MKKIVCGLALLAMLVSGFSYAQTATPGSRPHQPANRTTLVQPLPQTQGGLGTTVPTSIYDTVKNSSAGQALTNWWGGLAAMFNGSSNVTIFMAGDSTFQGTGSTNLQNVGAQLSNALNASGVPSSFMSGFPVGSTGDGTINIGSWSIAGGQTFGGASLFATSTTATPYTYVTNKNADTVQIFYSTGGGSGTISYTIDGGSPVNINQSGVSAFTSTTVSGLPLKPHTIALNWVSGNVNASAIRAWDSTKKQVLVTDAGIAFTTACSWATSSGVTGLLDTLTATGQKLTIIDLGINDANANSGAGVDIPVYTNCMQTVINKAKTVGDVLLLIPAYQNTTGSNPTVFTQDKFTAAMYALAKANNLPVVDSKKLFGTWAQANAASLMYDETHPNQNGYFDQMNAVVNMIAGHGLNAAPTFSDVYTIGNVGIGTYAPLASLDMSKRTDALMLPVGTTGQRPIATNLTNGMLRYNSDTPAVEAYQNNAWVALNNGSGSNPSCTTNQMVFYAGSGTTTSCLTLGTNLSITSSTLNATGSSTVTLGTSTSATNPQISGSAGNGFYTAGAGLVDVAIGSTKITEVNSTGLTVTTSATTPGMVITSTGNTTFMTGMNLFAPNLGNGNQLSFYIGTNSSSNNSAGVSFNNNGSAASNNLELNVAGNSAAIQAYTTAKIIVSPSSQSATPKSNLDVTGNVSIGSGYSQTTAAPTDGAIIKGVVGIGTATPAANVSLDVRGPIKLNGYTVGTLPTGSVGAIAYVTDQLTTCAVAGAALTGGGAVTCPVFYNGSAWVGN